jgi:hypothetical protein
MPLANQVFAQHLDQIPVGARRSPLGLRVFQRHPGQGLGVPSTGSGGHRRRRGERA